MKRSTKLVARKVLNSLITVMLVVMLNFVLFRLMPGNPINTMVPNDPKIPQEYKEQLIEKYGLLDPLPEQFVKYLKSVFTLDFGDSFIYRNTPATDLILNNLRWTLLLTGTSSVLMIAIGMSMGVLSAWKRGSWFDTGSLAFSLFFYAMPTFWFAMMLIVLFSIELPWFPSGGALTTGMDFSYSLDSIVDMLRHLFLPMISLTVGSIAAFSIIMRGSLVDVMTEEYITTARAKGLTEAQVLRHHAVPNAMLPMVALIAIDMAFVVGGAFQTEVVFNYPGIGWATVEATYQLDFPVLQAAFFLIAVVVIFANFAADVLMVYMDPRVKLG